jgi:hypothetical protein
MPPKTPLPRRRAREGRSARGWPVSTVSPGAVSTTRRTVVSRPGHPDLGRTRSVPGPQPPVMLPGRAGTVTYLAR